jgi:uncharacterized protein YabE (DUF348 family)
MKLQLRKSTTFISIGLALGGLFAVVAPISAAVVGHSAYAETTTGGKLVTVHDRGLEKTFVTDKTTLREALAASSIELDTHDAVEPGLDEQLVAANYQVNIYRARPVTVIDGATRQRIMTPYQSAERIAQDAGVQLYPEDQTSVARSNDIAGDGAGLALTVTRATPLTIDLYGKPTQVRTQAHTIGELLKEKKIELGSDGRASLPFETPITEGMNIRVWREGKQTITVDEGVAFSVEQVKDADQPVGYKSVQTAGVNGQRSVTYEVEVLNGQEVSRTEIASIVTTAPVTQVEVVGTKPKTIPYTGGGTKTDWLAASNIPQESWGYADFMVQKESGWNPNAMNKSSGACGLAQALPCSKLGPNWNDPVVALNWMNNYAVGRYGSWEKAYNFWIANRWY